MWGDSPFDIHVNAWELPQISSSFDSNYLQTYVFFYNPFWNTTPSIKIFGILLGYNTNNNKKNTNRHKPTKKLTTH